MVIECCAQERTYIKFYGLLGERFCRVNRIWAETFSQCFETLYETIHRYETNRIRHIAKFFSHLLSSDALAWTILFCIKLTQEDTTSSSRIFLKDMLQELTESMGLQTLNSRLQDPLLRQTALTGLFPLDHPRNTRFAINFYTGIGLGGLR